MDREFVIRKTAEYVEKKLGGEATGHDWWHVFRVWKTALYIGRREKNADLFIIELAALLHDIADYKFHGGDASAGPEAARRWLAKNGLEKEVIGRVAKIIGDINFRGARAKQRSMSKESLIVRDADWLDALGAIGIARCFATGGRFGRPIYEPAIEPKLHKNFEEYKRSKVETTSVNHFYEKLLLLKDRLHTETARKIARKRHLFIKRYLEEFFQEWHGR